MRRPTPVDPEPPPEAGGDHVARRAEAERLAEAATAKMAMLLGMNHMPAWQLMTASKLPVTIVRKVQFERMNDVYNYIAAGIIFEATHGRTDAWYNPTSARKVLIQLFKSIGVDAKL